MKESTRAIDEIIAELKIKNLIYWAINIAGEKSQ